MSINFVAIDFETANRRRASACSVGLTKVLDGKIIDSFYSLINPEDSFDPFNTYIHGITEDMVISAPNYHDIIKQIKRFVGDLPMVAHNASFDMGVIRDSNDRYHVNDFEVRYFDSYYLSRQYIKSISYKLNYLSTLLDINLAHHNALSDATACAELVLYLCKENHCSDIQSLLDGASYNKMGTVINSVGSSFRRNNSLSGSKRIDTKNIINSVDITNFNESHPFYGKNICFTGKLSSMTRVEAMTLLAECGGTPENSVTKKVNFLVLGEQDFRVVGDTLKSSKIIKAEKLLDSGQDIQLLSEDDYLRML